MKWWHRINSVLRAKRATNANEAPQTVGKSVLEDSALLRAAPRCAIHAASRSFSVYTSRRDRSPSTSLRRRASGLLCWSSPFLSAFFSCTSNARACVRRVFPPQKKESVTIFVNSVTYIKRRRIHFVWQEGPNSPSEAVGRVRGDWLISGCAQLLSIRLH